MVLGGKEGMECEIHVARTKLEQVTEFKYLGCVLNESDKNDAEHRGNVASWRKVASAIRYLVNARNLQLECEKVLYGTLLLPVLLYNIEAVVWREEKRSKIRTVQTDNLRGLLLSGEWKRAEYEG